MENIKDLKLEDGTIYTGWCELYNNILTPQGCGKKTYKDHYHYGNFRSGIATGPGITSYDTYMYASQFKNDLSNGWGLRMERGNITEFGFYKDNVLLNDLSCFVHWFFFIMKKSKRWGENMLNMYTFKETKDVSELLIGFKSHLTPNGLVAQHMGFRFKSDGSVWIGSTNGTKLSGCMIHFRPDGLIDAGNFDNGVLANWINLQKIIDRYFLLNLISSDSFDEYRNEFKHIEEIEEGRNYFVDTKQKIAISNDNSFAMQYFAQEVALFGSHEFITIEKEVWSIGDKYIVTPHGKLQIEDVIFVNEGPLVGIQFTVSGVLNDNFTPYSDLEISIKTFALVRQPNNAWLWVYAFDQFNRQMFNFCGCDELDGLSHYINMMRRIYK